MNPVIPSHLRDKKNSSLLSCKEGFIHSESMPCFKPIAPKFEGKTFPSNGEILIVNISKEGAKEVLI